MLKQELKENSLYSGENPADLTTRYTANNYRPLPVTLTRGAGEWVWDTDGKRYLDMLGAYSALNHGHSHPVLLDALRSQSEKLTLTSRAFHNDQLGPWAKQLCALSGKDIVLPMNTGTEAVETALKIARKWGYEVKGVPSDSAEIIVCNNNFHGRTITICGFSSEEQYRKGFGPFPAGFKTAKYGSVQDISDKITSKTIAILLEPIQGEAGVIVPPEGYLAAVSELCRTNNILLIVDEIQTGLGRTGKMFAFQHENCHPSLIVMGKALGGGLLPISAVAGNKDVMGIIRPGDHGSTFGGNPLACAVSRAALDLLTDENFCSKAERLGTLFRDELQNLPGRVVKEVRGKGLLNAIEIQPTAGSGRFYVELLMRKGILSKDTHNTCVRFAPPLVVGEDSLKWALGVIRDVFSQTEKEWREHRL